MKCTSSSTRAVFTVSVALAVATPWLGYESTPPRWVANQLPALPLLT